MGIWTYIAVILLAYLIGSIPMGYLLVALTTGKDVRDIKSGRTGGTNAMRAAGLLVGVITSFFDIAKGAAGVWLAHRFAAGNPWLEILAPFFAVVGHNYSIYLVRRDEHGLKFAGGAGGTPSVGGAIALWPPLFLILIPLGVLIIFGIGYASVATLSMPLITALIFGYRTLAGIGDSSWYHVLYCFMVEALIVWSLRPNIRRLIQGTERVVGWRARRTESSHGED
jgi:glycerol-3-phosphate acyltransferase PlsY